MRLKGKNFQPWAEFDMEIDGLTVLVGPSNKGKCFAAGTPVLMFNGEIKPVENIQEGDLVMGPDSLPRLVGGLCRGRESMFRITPAKGGITWDCNESHTLALQVLNRGGGRRHLSVSRKDEIPVNEFNQKSKWYRRCARLYRSGVVHFSDSTSPLLEPYLVGYWLGDGGSDLHGFGVTTADFEVVSELEEVAKRFDLRVRKDQKKDNLAASYYLTDGRGKGKKKIGRNRLLNYFRGLSLHNNKHIPISYKTSHPEVRLQLLAGLMDSDGYLERGVQSQYEYVSVIKQLADDVAFVARSLGFAVSVNPKTVNEKVNYCYRVVIQGDLHRIPTLIKRKKADKRKHKPELITGFKVSPLGEGEYFGFSVDGDGLFLLGDFTVVHNSSLFRALKGILRNEIPEEFIRNNQDEPLEIELEVDGHHIKAIRKRKGSTKYIVDGKTYTSLGGKVPEEIGKLKFGEIKIGDFSVDPIFAHQNKAQFLIDSDRWKPQEINAILGAFSSTEKLDAGKKEANLRITQRKSEANTLASEIRSAEERSATLLEITGNATVIADAVLALERGIRDKEIVVGQLESVLYHQARLQPLQAILDILTLPDLTEVAALFQVVEGLELAGQSLLVSRFLRKLEAALDSTAVVWSNLLVTYKQNKGVEELLTLLDRAKFYRTEYADRLILLIEQIETQLVEVKALNASIAYLVGAALALQMHESLTLQLVKQTSQLEIAEAELETVRQEYAAAEAKKIKLGICPKCGFDGICPSCGKRLAQDMQNE